MISFVITARDEQAAVVRRTVDELRSTTPAAERELIVIDDGSESPVAGLPADVEVVRAAVPAGVSRARRLGCELAAGSVLVCLDAHMTFDVQWLDTMLEHVDSASLLCAAFWDYERLGRGYYGADFEWCAVRDYDAGVHPGFRPRHRSRPAGAGAPEVPMALGACYMLLRSSYEALGGFSPLFRTWGADEQDLSLRAWMARLGVRCVTDARVGHLSRAHAPYPVYFDQLEFNQLAMIRAAFDYRTVHRLEAFFEPLPGTVRSWLDQADLRSWRPVVQRARQMTDHEFLARFVPELAT
jgi:hypothetical protein